MTYVSRKKGFEIVFKSSKLYRNSFDQINKTDGLRVTFFMGRYVTTDKDIIRLIDHWMTQHPSELKKYDERLKAKIDEAKTEAEEQAKKDYAEQLALEQAEKEAGKAEEEASIKEEE